MLSELAKQQLRKAGWYEGRKIDLTKYEEVLDEKGVELFPAARKFLEEFGDLYIADKIEDLDSKDGYYIKESRIGYPYTDGERYFQLEEKVKELTGQRILMAGAIDCGNIYLFISEDGKFYTNWYNIGLTAENSDQLWNEYYGEDYGEATWDDLKAGKGRTMKKKSWVNKYL